MNHDQNTIAMLRADFEAKFLAEFTGHDPLDHDTRKQITTFVRKWALEQIRKHNGE